MNRITNEWIECYFPEIKYECRLSTAAINDDMVELDEYNPQVQTC